MLGRTTIDAPVIEHDLAISVIGRLCDCAVKPLARAAVAPLGAEDLDAAADEKAFAEPALHTQPARLRFSLRRGCASRAAAG